MFRMHVSGPGRAVTAGVKPPSAHHLRGSLPVGLRPVHPSVFLGYVESASTALCLTITGDLQQAAGQRSDRLAAPLSTDSVP
jgi:hypothetical protein